MCCKVKEMTAKIKEGAIFGISTCNNKKCTKRFSQTDQRKMQLTINCGPGPGHNARKKALTNVQFLLPYTA